MHSLFLFLSLLHGCLSCSMNVSSDLVKTTESNFCTDKLIRCFSKCQANDPMPFRTFAMLVREYMISTMHGLLPRQAELHVSLIMPSLLLGTLIYVTPSLLFADTLRHSSRDTTDVTLLYLGMPASTKPIAFLLSYLPHKTNVETI